MALSDSVSQQYLNVPVEVEDPSAPDQCMDWAFLACDRMGIPRAAIRQQYAKQVWENPSATEGQYFERVTNTPSYVPPANAFAVFGTQVGPSGHIAWVLSGSDTENLRTSDQNWDGIQRVELVDHTGYFGVEGFLVPKGAPAPAPVTGGVMEALRACNVRAQPNTESALAGSEHLTAGQTFSFSGIVAGEAVSQNGVTTNQWARSTAGHYVWLGNLKQLS